MERLGHVGVAPIPPDEHLDRRVPVPFVLVPEVVVKEEEEILNDVVEARADEAVVHLDALDHAGIDSGDIGRKRDLGADASLGIAGGEDLPGGFPDAFGSLSPDVEDAPHVGLDGEIPHPQGFQVERAPEDVLAAMDGVPEKGVQFTQAFQRPERAAVRPAPNDVRSVKEGLHADGKEVIAFVKPEDWGVSLNKGPLGRGGEGLLDLQGNRGASAEQAGRGRAPGNGLQEGPAGEFARPLRLSAEGLHRRRPKKSG